MYAYIYLNMVRTPWEYGYMALWGFGAKCWMGEWAGWVTDGWIDC